MAVPPARNSKYSTNFRTAIPAAAHIVPFFTASPCFTEERFSGRTRKKPAAVLHDQQFPNPENGPGERDLPLPDRLHGARRRLRDLHPEVLDRYVEGRVVAGVRAVTTFPPAGPKALPKRREPPWAPRAPCRRSASAFQRATVPAPSLAARPGRRGPPCGRSSREGISAPSPWDSSPARCRRDAAIRLLRESSVSLHLLLHGHLLSVTATCRSSPEVPLPSAPLPG